MNIRRARYFERNGQIICSTSRCASTTMALTLDQRFTDFNSHRGADTVDFTGKEVFLWIRNPYDRLESTYKLFRSLSPETFGAQILKRDDIHWIPQIDTHTVNGVFVPTVVMRFEDFATTWPQHFPDVVLDMARDHPQPKKVSWANLSAAMPAEMVAALDAKYAADMALWSALP